MIESDLLAETCRDCPCEKACYVTRQDGQYENAIVFETFGTEAVLKDDPWAGKRGGQTSLVKEVAQQVGLDLENTYVCAALNCRPAGKGEALLKKSMVACRERLLTELRYAGVKKVLCLGTIGFSALTGAEKNLPITKHRGRWVKAYGMDILGTLPPGMVMPTPEWFRDFAYDLEKFATTTGRDPYPNVVVHTIETPKELRSVLKRINTEGVVSMDLETTGLSPVKDKVLCVGIGTVATGEEGETIIVPEHLLERVGTWRLLSDMLSNADLEVVFHNAKFDLQFLKHGFLERGLEYDPQNVQDTMLLHYAQDERPMGKYPCHRLDTLARVRFDAPDYSINIPKFLKAWKTAEGKERETLRTDLHNYLGLDCYYTRRLYPLLWNENYEEDQDLLMLYEDTLLPGALALADVELNGVKLDLEFYRKAEAELKGRAEKILARLRASIGNKEFNPNSPQQVKRLVYEDLGLPYGEAALNYVLGSDLEWSDALEEYKAKQKKKSSSTLFTSRRGKQREGPTAKAVLKKLAKHFPEHGDVLRDILEYRNLTKNVGTYVTGMLDRVDEDGRIRGNFNLHGTATGRLSSDNPNLQNIPDSSHTGVEVRNGFIADEGCVLIEADYSQLELRVAAHLSEDEGFKQVFIDGRDVHQEVTWALFHKTKEEASKYERYMAKCMNFGVMYARGPSSLANGPEMEYVEDNGGTPWTVEEVTEFFDKMLKNWPKYNQWMEDQKQFGYAEGYVKGPFGNRRRFDYIPSNDGASVGRQSVNTPIQGTASHITLTSLVRINARLPEGARIVSTVHDSILIECLRELVNEVLTIIREEMEENVTLETDVPFVSDADVALRWGEMSKWSWDPDTLTLTENFS